MRSQVHGLELDAMNSDARQRRERTLLVILEWHPTWREAADHCRTLATQWRGLVVCHADTGAVILVPADALASIAAAPSQTSRVARLTPPQPIAPAPSRPSQVAKLTPPEPKTRIARAEANSVAPKRPRQVVGTVERIEISRKPAFDRARVERLQRELRHAMGRLPPKALAAWAAAAAQAFLKAFIRRIGNVVDLSVFVLQGAGNEVVSLTKAIREGGGVRHLSERSRAALAAGAGLFQSSRASVRRVVEDFRARPSEVGPELLVMALAFFVAGGGIDGDGGVPDADIAMFGIGGHRSIFTHSIIAGSMIEGGMLSLVSLITLAHKHLPANHDDLWDTMHARCSTLGGAISKGASAGIAYHLGVDTLVEPAAYKDLPFPADEEVHQVITGVNAAAEASSARNPTVARRARTNATKARQTTDMVNKSHSPTNAPARPGEASEKGAFGAAIGGALAIAAWFLS